MELHEVTQRMLEAYETHLLSEREDVVSAAKYNRIIIESARDAGIATDLPADLMDCAPYEVKTLTTDILTHIAAAKAPPDPN